jgi:type III secretion protein Q
MDDGGRVPLPFDLPLLSRGFAALTPGARAAGARAAEAVQGALAALIGGSFCIGARPCAGAAAPRSAVARVAVDLTAVPATAVLEVDPALVVALVDALAGGAGDATAATALTPVEAAALELFVLAALDGACAVASVEDALGPRLARGVAEPSSALAVELDVAAGPLRGRCRLLVAAAAVRALRDPCAGPGPAAATPIAASLRSGRATLHPGELDALSPGDVVLLDAPGEALDVLVLPGGARLAGRLEDRCFRIEEVTTMERNAQLPILLEVELARVEVPLSEIARLEPGAVLALGIDRRGLVTLRIGERSIARGELVDVDGAVGVRIISLEGAP